MAIKVGDKMPQGTFMTLTADGPAPVQAEEFFAGRKVVLFGLPGAFTPTCSAKHVPGYLAHAADLKAKGVDAIGCMAVNDCFVMGAWGKDQNVGENIAMLADGSAEYTKAIGLELDLGGLGMGTRCTRFSLIVDDGVVQAVNVEENPAELDNSSAETALGQL